MLFCFVVGVIVVVCLLFSLGGFDCSLFCFVCLFVLRLCIMTVNLLRDGVESIKIMGFSENIDTILN